MGINVAEIDEFDAEDSADETFVEETEAEEVELEEGEESSNGEAAEAPEEEEELIVTIGDSPAPEEEAKGAPEWVKELRKSHKELQRENRELKERFKSVDEAPKAPELGKKPTLEQLDYDTEKFEVAITEWFDSKRQVEEYQRQVEQAQRQQQEGWQQKLNGYNEAKAQLKVKDFADAEDNLKDVLSVTQQGILLQGAKNPALLVYALGKNQKRAKELAAITDPIKFAFELATLESDLKTSNRKPSPPQPEKSIKSTGKISGGGSDATLERLRDEATKTGNLTKLHAYKRQLRDKQR
tara:strand:+ start:390 stop:1280 length:891 start_codon:yes stop_codon:yes gene_type:complete